MRRDSVSDGRADDDDAASEPRSSVPVPAVPDVTDVPDAPEVPVAVPVPVESDVPAVPEPVPVPVPVPVCLAPKPRSLWPEPEWSGRRATPESGLATDTVVAAMW